MYPKASQPVTQVGRHVRGRRRFRSSRRDRIEPCGHCLRHGAAVLRDVPGFERVAFEVCSNSGRGA